MTTLIERSAPKSTATPATTQPIDTVLTRTEPALVRRTPFTLLGDLADVVIAVFKPFAVPLLRIALAVVYVWFGVLKLLGLSPVADLVAGMVPFVPAETAVMGMGIAEVVLGLALAVGVFVPWIAAIQVAHLFGTFLVFVVHPDIAFVGNPFVVTLEGEFIAKNLVLVTALIVVATHTARAKRAKAAPIPNR
ncbi:MAG: DoxX family protein [Actinomycetota bacterium]|nr:DoxX family protein [Actinomycetota bacterium]